MKKLINEEEIVIKKMVGKKPSYSLTKSDLATDVIQHSMQDHSAALEKEVVNQSEIFDADTTDTTATLPGHAQAEDEVL